MEEVTGTRALIAAFVTVLALILGGLGIVAYLRGRSGGETSRSLSNPGTFTTLDEAQKAVPFAIPCPRNMQGWRLKSVEVHGSGTFILGEGPVDKGRMAAARIVEAAYVHSETETQLRLSAYLNPGVELVHGPDNPRTTYRDIAVHGHGAVLAEVAASGTLEPGGAMTPHQFLVQWYQGEVLIGASWFTLDDALTLEQVLDFLQTVQ